jgi:hypothetical protein
MVIEYQNQNTETQFGATREFDTTVIFSIKLFSISSDRCELHSTSVLSNKMAARMIYLSVLKSLAASV